MQMPPESAGSDVLIETYGVHLLATLGADPAATDIASAFQARQTALEAAAAGRKASEAATIAAEALALMAEVAVEQVIRKIESRTLEAVKKRRDLDPYARLFPQNLGGALAPQGRAQITEAKRIADLILSPDGTRLVGITEEIAAFAPELRAAMVILVARIDGVELAEAAAVAAFGAELTARRQWREQYRKTEGLLTALYPTDRRRVESFFKGVKKAKKNGEATKKNGEAKPTASA
jgi:hypothetical protein